MTVFLNLVIAAVVGVFVFFAVAALLWVLMLGGDYPEL